MEERFECECGNNLFWFFWDRVRCTGCYNEYKQTKERNQYINPYSESDGVITHYTEYWMRRFNKLENKYDDNWEKAPKTLKNKL